LNKILNPEDATKWLNQGKILIHPTEGVWGIGCDAFNPSAVEKINILKQRDSFKNFILLASSMKKALQYFQPLSVQQNKFVKKVWPGHTTIIFNSNDNVPCHLKAYDSTIAVRVSNHKPIVNLLSLFKNLMVSTSANISNLPTPKKLEDIAKIFPDPDVAFYYFENGESKKPSSIIDLNTMDYIRE
tara:strand:- start:1156 stop:1713 length:558 start_codon:yes stop_codon:yes gene_type:complete